MSGFANAVVGGAETLIRTAIKSFGYVANTVGWRIARDGTADLANATIRGSLVVNGNNSSSITISNPGGSPEIDLMPPTLTGYAGFNASRVAGSLTADSNNGGTQNSSSASIALIAPTINGRPTTGIDFTSASYDGTTKPQIHVSAAASGVDMVFDGPGCFVNIGGAIQAADDITSLLTASVGTDLTIGNTINFTGNPVDAGKGTLYMQGRNTDTGVVTGAGEGSVLVKTVTLKAGRAYRITTSGIGQLTAGAPSRMFGRIRKTSTTGTLIAQSAVAMGNNSTPSDAGFTVYTWVGGVDQTDVLAWTIITGIVGVSCQVIGATSPSNMEVVDIGPASRVSGWANEFI